MTNLPSFDLLALAGQVFESQDLLVIGLLVFFEGILSIDNAIVLGLLAKRLPKDQQRAALTYGLVGAFVFRSIAVLLSSYLLSWRFVKLLGGAYLVYIAVKHLFFQSQEVAEAKLQLDEQGQPTLRHADDGSELSLDEQLVEIRERLPVPTSNQVLGRKFWMTVGVIEITDIAFAVDSILAAMALIGSPPPNHPLEMPHPKLWVVVLGGILGIVLMRVAASIFIQLLEKFPRLELSAYLLVAVVGLKLLLDWGLNSSEHPHTIDFHDGTRLEFWAFWLAMAACLVIGFLRPAKPHTSPADM